MNNVNLIGRTVRDVELKYIPNSGTALATVTIAIDKGLSKDKKQEFESQNKPTADFLPIVVWGKSAEYLANYLKKGKLLAVQGRIETGSYDDKDGKKVYTTKINASNVQILEYENDNKSNDTGTQDFHPIDNEDIPF